MSQISAEWVVLIREIRRGKTAKGCLVDIEKLNQEILCVSQMSKKDGPRERTKDKNRKKASVSLGNAQHSFNHQSEGGQAGTSLFEDIPTLTPKETLLFPVRVLDQLRRKPKLILQPEDHFYVDDDKFYIQLDWAMWCLDSCTNTVLGMSVKVFLNEISI